HVDLGAQNILAIGKITGTHALEQLTAFGWITLAVGAGRARLGQRTALLADGIGVLAVNVCQTAIDQVQSILIERLEIIRGVALVLPLVAKPGDVFLDRIDVTLL